jgi:hypothetical protein
MDSHGLHPDVLIFHPTTDHLDFPMVTSHPSGGRQVPGIGSTHVTPWVSSSFGFGFVIWFPQSSSWREANSIVTHCDESETGLAYRAKFVSPMNSIDRGEIE